MASFTPRPLFPQWKSTWYPLDRRLGGPQSRSGRGGEEKNSQPPPGIEPSNPDRPARSLVAIPTELSRLFASHSSVIHFTILTAEGVLYKPQCSSFCGSRPKCSQSGPVNKTYEIAAADEWRVSAPLSPFTAPSAHEANLTVPQYATVVANGSPPALSAGPFHVSNGLSHIWVRSGVGFHSVVRPRFVCRSGGCLSWGKLFVVFWVPPAKCW
jgi:hypothetical protein